MKTNKDKSRNGVTERSEHTPTPWFTIKWMDPEVKKEIMAIFGQGNTKGTSSEYLFESNFTLPLELNKLNAAFIIRAVNSVEALEAENKRLKHSHEALLEAAKEALECATIPGGDIAKRAKNVVEKLTKAIRQAEGK